MAFPSLLFVAFAFSVLAGVLAIEEPADSKVQVLRYGQLTRFLKKNDVSIVEFYAPWCGHCQHLAPVYRDAAAIMAEANLPFKVGFAKFDDTDDFNKQMRAGAEEMFNFTSYPTLIVFKKNKVKAANKEHWKRKYKKVRWQYTEADAIIPMILCSI